ncbi:hypothetical protein U1Q18_044793 [Sarracenia purpurea var. burkii]
MGRLVELTCKRKSAYEGTAADASCTRPVRRTGSFVHLHQTWTKHARFFTPAEDFTPPTEHPLLSRRRIPRC